MKNNMYEPEDLEKLLTEKSFSELLPEEKAFVLQYVDGDLEYDQMRSTFSKLGELPAIEPEISASPQLKENLMAAFKTNQVSEVADEEVSESRLAAFWIWFWDTNKTLFARPAFQLASLAVVGLIGYQILGFNADTQVAENKAPKEEKLPIKKSKNNSKPDDKTSGSDDVKLETVDSNGNTSDTENNVSTVSELEVNEDLKESKDYDNKLKKFKIADEELLVEGDSDYATEDLLNESNTLAETVTNEGNSADDAVLAKDMVNSVLSDDLAENEKQIEVMPTDEMIGMQEEMVRISSGNSITPLALDDYKSDERKENKNTATAALAETAGSYLDLIDKLYTSY